MELKAVLCYCPHCGDWYRVRPHLVGSFSICRKCGKSFTLTAAPDQKTFQRKTLLLLKRLSLLLYPAMLVAGFAQRAAWPFVVMAAVALFHIWCVVSVRYATTPREMATRRQLPLPLRFLWAVLVVLLFGASIGFYATQWKSHCLVVLRLVSLAIPASLLLDSVWSLVRVGISPHRSRELLSGASSTMAGILPFGAISVLVWFNRLPPPSWPWILPLAVVVLPFLLTAAHRTVLESGSSGAILKHVGIAVVCAGLTWAQLMLVQRLDTWLFVVIGIIPVPLLGVTTLLTLAASVFSATVLFSAGVFHPLRAAYGIR